MFAANHSRFATFGVISNLPGEIIDSIWLIIDRNLQGVVPLNNLLRFDLQNHQGKLTIHFSEEGAQTEMSV
ncbi:GTP cyclohydrolase, partial [Lacticaseibacillus rhamnosus]